MVAEPPSDAEAVPGDCHLVLVRETLRSDGSWVISMRVFCPRESGSVDLDVCRVCPACEDMRGDVNGEAWVVCDAGPKSAAQQSFSIGPSLHGSVLCAQSDVLIGSVTAILVERELPQVYVVDESGVLVGAVTDSSLLRMPRHRPGDRLEHVMSFPRTLGEEMGVHEALVGMASAHARQLAVITRKNLLVGTLDDLSLLRQYNRARRRT